MRVRFIRPGNMAQAITSQLQPVASEVVPALQEAASRRTRPHQLAGLESAHDACSTTSSCKVDDLGAVGDWYDQVVQPGQGAREPSIRRT